MTRALLAVSATIFPGKNLQKKKWPGEKFLRRIAFLVFLNLTWVDVDLFLFPESSKSKKLSDALNDQKMYGKNGNKSSTSPLKGQGGGAG